MPIAENPEPRPAEQPADDPFADLVLDDEFVKGASRKEASGRARMLTAKWRREPPPEPEAWRPPTEVRRGRFGGRPQKLDPWGRPVRRRRLNWQAPVFVVLAVALALAALNIDRLRDWYHRDVATPVAAPTTQAPETAAPTAAPPTTDPKTPTVDHPWAGSPAEAWPAGADAIQLPEAKAVGTFGADEVAAQLKLVKDYLVASNLDPAVISGGEPRTALGLLNGPSRARAQQALQHPSHDNNPAGWFTRFDPRTAILVGSTVKAMGHLSFESDGENGLLVHADYTFVYALRPGPERYHGPTSTPSPSGVKPVSWVADAPPGNTQVARTIIRHNIDFRFYDPARYRADPEHISIAEQRSDAGNNGCDHSDGFFHPGFPQDPYDGHTPSPGASSHDPYDRSKPLDEPSDGKCGVSTRT